MAKQRRKYKKTLKDLVYKKGCGGPGQPPCKEEGADKNKSETGSTAQYTSEGSVKTLQKLLKKLGYYKGNVEGVNGPLTRAAYDEFEEDNSGMFSDNLEVSALPLNVRALANDVTGIKAPLSRETLTKGELEALQKIVRKNLAKGKNYIEYGDYNTGSKYGDVGGGEGNLKTVKKILDPNYRLKTTTGQAGIAVIDNDTLVVDSYDFNDAREGQGGAIAFAREVADNPSLYNIMRKVGKNWGSVDGEGAPVIINTSDMRKKKKQKLASGTGKNGVVRNYIESPQETLTESQIAMAKAKLKGESNPFAQGLEMLGGLGMNYGLGMMGGTGGLGKGISQGLGAILQNYATGGQVVDPKKKKVGSRDLTAEEAAMESDSSQFTPEGILQLFGADIYGDVDRPSLDLGKYAKPGYFAPEQDASGRFTLRNTKNNPANYELYKKQLAAIQELNPDATFSKEGFTPLINQKAFGGTAGVDVEVEGDEVGETPDGQLIDFDGASHENGGIEVNLPEGTEIFSKRIKVGGKTMAERKMGREKKVLTLEKLLEKSGNDKILKDTLARTQANNEKEEEQDQKLQKIVGEARQQANAAYGTGKEGLKKYQYGTDNVEDPYANLSPEELLARIEAFNVKNASGVLPGEKTGVEGFLPNLTGGDITGLLGTAYSAFKPMKNTLENRAGDTPNINAFEDFGADALDAIESAKGYIGGQRDKALGDIETNRNRAMAAGRRGARGINTSRALDLATEAGATKAEGDVYDNFAKQMMGMLTKQAGFENQQDAQVMSGEATRDTADRMDRDNFYSQMARDIATKGQGIQQVGKMLNQNKKNTVSENLLNESSEGYMVKNGEIFLKSGGKELSAEESRALLEAQAASLGMTLDDYEALLKKQKE